MLSKERIRLMTHLAAYEQGEEKKDRPMGKFSRRDYVAIQMVRTFFSATIAFFLLFFLRVLYGMEDWINTMYDMEYRNYFIRLLLIYAVFVALYELAALGVYRRRYQKGHKNQKLYHSRLKKVERLYEREEKLVSPEEWGA